MELSKGESCTVLFCEVDGVWLDHFGPFERCVCVWVCTFAAGWRGRRMVFMVRLRRCIFKMLHANLFPSLSVFPLSFNILRCHILHHPFLSLSLFLHPSAPQNINLVGFKYAHRELGVNHHFVFITHSLSSLSRCARGTRSWGVRKYWCCFWLQSSVFQWALPQRLRWFSSCFPTKWKLWLARGLFPARQSTRLT